MAPLTPLQRSLFWDTPNNWVSMPDEWHAGTVFLRLVERGFVEMHERRRSYSALSVGPGPNGGHYWQTRRTEAGRQAIASPPQPEYPDIR
ncbi:hypothetical protein OCOJLMKI_5278 [Methylobacterium iners]|uniref:Uncharacterized protein n=1 Tax=Methylobacterium iners TaxID=418707 RepID=A0ABQ4S852_9HYPH|nr:hypothetical protein OCOJLMKI_5278 [Methylobacterium iners]